MCTWHLLGGRKTTVRKTVSLPFFPSSLVREADTQKRIGWYKYTDKLPDEETTESCYNNTLRKLTWKI